MKKAFLLLMTLVLQILQVRSQDECVLPMMLVIPQDGYSMSVTTEKMLESKLRQAITLNGMNGDATFSNFYVVANVVEGSKEVLSGKRPLVTMTLDLELFVGNVYSGDNFSSTSIRLNGAGRNENKAFTSAFSSISSNNMQLQKFLQDAKKKIKQYYNTQIPTIIRQAKSLAVKREYEDALCLLSSVPTCVNKYGEVEDAMLAIFQQYIDYDCAVKVAKARSVWVASQDKEGAILAGAYLAAIDPNSSCWGEAKELAEDIRLRIGDDWEFYKELQRENIALKKTQIEAIRAIGVAYGQNQKAHTISEHWIVR